MINLTSYITILLICVLKLEDILLFSLESKEIIKLIFKVLSIKAVIKLVERVVKELLLIVIIRVIKV